jgi:hypothetical protein
LKRIQNFFALLTKHSRPAVAVTRPNSKKAGVQFACLDQAANSVPLTAVGHLLILLHFVTSAMAAPSATPPAHTTAAEWSAGYVADCRWPRRRPPAPCLGCCLRRACARPWCRPWSTSRPCSSCDRSQSAARWSLRRIWQTPGLAFTPFRFSPSVAQTDEAGGATPGFPA